MTTKDDIYIQALEYAESKMKFTLQELIDELNLTDEATIKLFRNQIHYKQIFFTEDGNYINNPDVNKIALYFSVEDKFRLVNHRSLEDARASSRQSTYYATAALIISIITAAISIYYANPQLKAGINIPEEFVSKIKNINQKQDEISSTLIFIKNNGLNSASGPSKKH